MSGLDTKSDPFMSKQEKKVKRRHRQKKFYYETEGRDKCFIIGNCFYHMSGFCNMVAILPNLIANWFQFYDNTFY